MKKLLLVLLLTSFFCQSQIESVQSGYYHAMVGDSILQNRTTERKAKDDGINYCLKYNLKSYRILFPDYVDVTLDFPELVVSVPQDTIRTVELIVTNSYMGVDVTPAFQPNKIKIEYFFGNAGNLANFKNTISNGKVADSISYLTELKIPQSNPNLDRYGIRVTGYINTPITGDYRFRSYGDDELEFFIWQDEADKTLLTSQAFYSNVNEYKYPTQTSELITLSEGRYSFEIFMYEGGGGDYFGVEWQLPNEAEFKGIEQLFLTER